MVVACLCRVRRVRTSITPERWRIAVAHFWYRPLMKNFKKNIMAKGMDVREGRIEPGTDVGGTSIFFTAAARTSG
jgi:hypothetical protein